MGLLWSKKCWSVQDTYVDGAGHSRVRGTREGDA
jgi:hypothetical protein